MLLGASVLLLASCASAPHRGGTAWYKPWTWGSTSEATRVEKAAVKVDAAREKAIGNARELAHKTQDALALAGDSRPVVVARDFNADAVALLDQVAGPTITQDLQKWQKQVQSLCSDDPLVRIEAEKLRQKDRQDTANISKKLADTEAKLKEYEAALPDALRREAETANKYRALIWGFWGLVVIALLVSAGLLYVKYALGGIPQAMGKGLALLRAKNPEAGELATNIFDGLLNRHEQQRISQHA